MGAGTFEAVFLLTCLLLLDENLGDDSTGNSRLRILERRHQFTRFPFVGLVLDDKDDVVEKRQDNFDDYGHMRFGKRGEDLDDYGHMRFGKRD